jgi:hypothetical protein
MNRICDVVCRGRVSFCAHCRPDELVAAQIPTEDFVRVGDVHCRDRVTVHA